MNKKFTKTEKSWILYDWANSVYATNMMAAIFPIYFGSVCAANGVDNMVLWSIGTSIATFTVAILAPFIGAIGSNKGFKKMFFMVFLILGVVFTSLCAITNNYIGLLIGYVVSHIGFSGANLFYDSFLTDVTTEERMDKVSSMGYAMGYLGGSTIPFVASIVLLILTDMSDVSIKFSIVITAVWWLIFSIPFVRNVKQIHYVEKPSSHLIANSFKNLSTTFKSIIANKKMLFFILAYFFYIDGVSTIISVSTSYGTALKLDSTMMILALLVTQIVAVPCSIIFGKLTPKFGSINMIFFAIFMYLGICIVGYFMGHNIEANPNSTSALNASQTLFWILAFMVGTVQGGIQSISRSFFGKLVPAERSSEYFGFFDIFGKFAAVMGPAVISVVKLTTGSDALGVLSVSMLFILGLVFLFMGKKHFSKI